MYYVGWSSSTGEADWALRPLLASESLPPKMFNTAVLQERRSGRRHRQGAGHHHGAEKAKLYTDAQQRIWKDAPWAFLVTEQLLSAHAQAPVGLLRDARTAASTSTKSNSSNPGHRS
jgi:glutathione transport system substrate-binding protein